MPISDDDFRSALSRLAGGVCIVATGADGDRRGVTATAVCSVSAAPPTVLICVNLSTGTCRMIEDVGRFSINLLSEHDRLIAETFAGRNGKSGNERFEIGDWLNSPVTNVPILNDALATMECRVCDIVRRGTHAVFFGEVERVVNGDYPPLVYQGGDFRSLSDEPQLRMAPRRVSA
jgi:flavin reductase (DIM6/NTAB) family NADH-FMN oxidoreductase RutF